MLDASKLTDDEVNCLALRLRAEFIRRKQANQSGQRGKHDYLRAECLDTFREAVRSHRPRHYHRILDSAFAVLPDPQPGDLVGADALERMRLFPAQASVDGEPWLDDPDWIDERLDREDAWLENIFCPGDYPAQAFFRYMAALRRDDDLVSAGVLADLAREALLEAKVNPSVVEQLDEYLESRCVRAVLEEAAEWLAGFDRALEQVFE